MAARDNPFYIDPVRADTALESLMGGYDRGQKAFKQRQMDEGRQRAMTALQGGGDLKGPLAELFGIGDVEAAKALGTYAHNIQTGEHQNATLAEQRRFHDVSASHQAEQLRFQREQADAAAKGFEHKEVDDGNGNKILVRINRQTGEVTRPPIAGLSTEPTNPYAFGKQTEAQAKDSLYANRMFGAEKVFRTIEQSTQKGAPNAPVEMAGTDRWQQGLKTVGGGLGYNLNSQTFQKFDQAQRDFINATLRRESGAVISPAEFDNANKQYFPQPGDGPQVIAQKRANRIEAIKGIAGGGGQSYRPPAVFDAQGNLGPNSRFNEPGAGAPQVPPGVAPKQEQTRVPNAPAINLLRSDPSPQARQEFDQIFGPGASARFLGG